MLLRCSEKKDMTEWNQWRKENPQEPVWLQNANFKGRHLQAANFMHANQYDEASHRTTSFGEVRLEGSVFEWANLRRAIFAGAKMDKTRFWSAHAEDADFRGTYLVKAELGVAHFENCDFSDAILENASFSPSSLTGAKFTKSDLRGCSMRACIVDGSTRFWDCVINRSSKARPFTDFSGTPLDSVIIDPATKQLLEYNIRRMNWEGWYPKQRWIVAKLAQGFWWLSEYGTSTMKVVITFLVFSFFFAVCYYCFGAFDYYLKGIENQAGIVANLFVDSKGVAVPAWLVPVRAYYFSIVTMTTLGFGDMCANSGSILGHIFLIVQVIFGYVLLGALVTRFAVLFTAGGPAGTFEEER